jgi:hypothetical protein
MLKLMNFKLRFFKRFEENANRMLFGSIGLGVNGNGCKIILLSQMVEIRIICGFLYVHV